MKPKDSFYLLPASSSSPATVKDCHLHSKYKVGVEVHYGLGQVPEISRETAELFHFEANKKN